MSDNTNTTNNSFSDALIDLKNLKDQLSKQAEQKFLKENLIKIEELTNKLLSEELSKDDDSNEQNQTDITTDDDNNTSNGSEEDLTFGNLDDVLKTFLDSTELDTILSRPDVDSVDITVDNNGEENKENQDKMDLDTYEQDNTENLSEEQINEILSQYDSMDETEKQLNESEIGDNILNAILDFFSTELEDKSTDNIGDNISGDNISGGIVDTTDGTAVDTAIVTPSEDIDSIGDTDDTSGSTDIDVNTDEVDNTDDTNTDVVDDTLDTENDDDKIEESNSISHKNLRSNTTGSKEHAQKHQDHVENVRGPKGLNESLVKELNALKEKVSNLLAEHKKLQTKYGELKNINEQSIERLDELRGKLHEATIESHKTMLVNQLFLENSTTKEEKETIVSSFMDAKTLKQINETYSIINSDLKNKSILSESISSQFKGQKIETETALLTENSIKKTYSEQIEKMRMLSNYQVEK